MVQLAELHQLLSWSGKGIFATGCTIAKHAPEHDIREKVEQKSKAHWFWY